MGKEETITNFSFKFIKVVSELINLREKIGEKEAFCKSLCATPSKFDTLMLSMEQYADLGKMSLEDAIGSLKIHYARLQEQEIKEEEQALLARVGEDQLACGCGHGYGRGQG